MVKEMDMMCFKVKEVLNEKLNSLKKCKTLFEKQLNQEQNELKNMIDSLIKGMNILKN